MEETDWNDDGFDSTFVFDAEVALDGVIEVSYSPIW